MYTFSVIMPNKIEYVDRIIDINNGITKSRITTFYGSLSKYCNLFTGFERIKRYSYERIEWDDWKKLAEYALSKNFDLVYLLDSSEPVDFELEVTKQKLDKLDILLNELKILGINKLRIASLKLMTYIEENYPYFEIMAAPNLEYNGLAEYKNLIRFHKNINQIVPTTNINKNFKLLSLLKKEYSNINIKIVLDEFCMYNCLYKNCCDKSCITNQKISAYDRLVFTTTIFPSQIKEYAKIGINDFELLGYPKIGYSAQLDRILWYISDLETNNSTGYYNLILDEFDCVRDSFLTLKELKKYLPDIKHFVKYGHLCSSICGTECNYCFKCSEKLKKIVNKYAQRNIPFVIY